jgi:hypothetical protein
MSFTAFMRRLGAAAGAIVLPAASRGGPGAETWSIEAYREDVIARLKAARPDAMILRTADPAELSIDGNVIFLGNLFLEVAALQGAACDDTVARQAEKLIAITRGDPPVWRRPFDELAPSLLLTLVPANYPDFLMTRPFGDEVRVAVVIDRPEAIDFVPLEAAAEWGVSLAAVFAAAEANLDLAAAAVEISAFPGLAVDMPAAASVTDDVYAAAYLLSPVFRKRLADRLGSPFFVAVPNREILHAWPARAAASPCLARVARDHATKPYPRTGQVFIVEGGEPRAATEADFARVGP